MISNSKIIEDNILSFTITLLVTCASIYLSGYSMLGYIMSRDALNNKAYINTSFDINNIEDSCEYYTAFIALSFIAIISTHKYLSNSLNKGILPLCSGYYVWICTFTILYINASIISNNDKCKSRLLINCTNVGNNLDNDVIYESVNILTVGVIGSLFIVLLSMSIVIKFYENTLDYDGTITRGCKIFGLYIIISLMITLIPITIFIIFIFGNCCEDGCQYNGNINSFQHSQQVQKHTREDEKKMDI